MPKTTATQQLHFLARDIKPLLDEVVRAYDYNPGSSDLDDEQPVTLTVTLGAYRRASRLKYQIEALE